MTCFIYPTCEESSEYIIIIGVYKLMMPFEEIQPFIDSLS